MTSHIIDGALRAIGTEIRESVISYFAPVRAVTDEVSRAVRAATWHGTTNEASFAAKTAPTQDGTGHR